jgi:hypothetical protein
MMSEIDLAKWIVMTALAGVVWFMKRTLDQTEKRIDVLEKGQSVIKEEYLHKNDFKEFKLELREMFNEIRTDIKELKK